MRGTLVTIALQGDYGKPRPALIIQSDYFVTHQSVTVLPVTSDLCQTPLFRVTIDPTAVNGLQRKSQVMVDKCVTVSRDKIGPQIGILDAEKLTEVDRCLAIFLGIVK